MVAYRCVSNKLYVLKMLKLLYTMLLCSCTIVSIRPSVNKNSFITTELLCDYGRMGMRACAFYRITHHHSLKGQLSPGCGRVNTHLPTHPYCRMSKGGGRRYVKLSHSGSVQMCE